jgi:hypothetical protein
MSFILSGAVTVYYATGINHRGRLPFTFLPGSLWWRGDVPLLIEHEWSRQIANTADGSLTIEDTPSKLTFSANPLFNSIFPLLKSIANARMGCSMGIDVLREETKRGLIFCREARIREVTLTTEPRVEQTISRVYANWGALLRGATTREEENFIWECQSIEDRRRAWIGY